MRHPLRFAVVAFAVLLVSCAPALVRQRTYRTNINGSVVDVSALAGNGLSCSGLSLPQTPTQEEINSAAALLPAKEGAELRQWYKRHKNVLDARVHSLHTCPFLAFAPMISSTANDPLARARGLHEFYSWKHKEQEDSDNCDCDKVLP